jgi:predicted ATPase
MPGFKYNSTLFIAVLTVWMPMVFLKSVSVKRTSGDATGFPFSLPLVQSFTSLSFDIPVTFLVGENGSGKSTILEAVAAAAGCVTVGSENIERDTTLDSIRAFSRCLRLAWVKRTHRGFFLRAEDFFGFAKRLRTMAHELQEEADKYSGDDYGSRLARGSLLGQRRALVEKYGENLDANSHGECFLKLFEERFVPEGLYLLDEPEVPLSPLRQLALLSMLKQMVITRNAQFIIATHSPILMAFPGARIYNFDEIPPCVVAYHDLDHVSLTRDFLNNPEQFLRRL